MFNKRKKLTISVCQKWWEATQLSWYNVQKIVINNSTFAYKNQESFKKILENCCQYLKYLTITVSHSWMYDIIKNKCQNLIHFNIQLDDDDEKNSYDNFLQLITSMSKLKYLKVVGMDITPSSNLSARIFDRLPNDIEEIHVTGNIKRGFIDQFILVSITLYFNAKKITPVIIIIIHSI